MGLKWKSVAAKWKGLSRKKKILSVLSILLVLLMAGGALGYFYWYNKPRQRVFIDPAGNLVVTNDNGPKLDGRVNILLIGVDERKNSKDKTYRTDTLILASIDPQSKKISMLSIPRDTRVQIPKRGWDKINAAAAYGGLNMTVAVVQQLTGVQIDGYVKTDFEGFKNIIDTLGGVTVNVEKDMYYVTGDTEDGVINLKKGEQVLDGSKALQYARFRHDALADISRTARQQVILKAVAKKLMQPEAIPKIPQLAMEFYNAVETNLPAADLVKIAQVAAKFDSSNVISQTLPGYFLDINGVSYWGVNPDDVKKVVADLFDKGISIGNTPDKLIDTSAKNSGSDSGEVPEEPAPVISIGSISVGERTETSITLSVSASKGIAAAEIYRNGQPIKGWAGGAITFTDSGLTPSTTYGYVLKVFDSNGKVVLTTNPVSASTLQAQAPPPDRYSTGESTGVSTGGSTGVGTGRGTGIGNGSNTGGGTSSNTGEGTGGSTGRGTGGDTGGGISGGTSGGTGGEIDSSTGGGTGGNSGGTTTSGTANPN